MCFASSEGIILLPPIQLPVHSLKMRHSLLHLLLALRVHDCNSNFLTKI